MIILNDNDYPDSAAPAQPFSALTAGFGQVENMAGEQQNKAHRQVRGEADTGAETFMNVNGSHKKKDFSLEFHTWRPAIV